MLIVGEERAGLVNEGEHRIAPLSHHQFELWPIASDILSHPVDDLLPVSRRDKSSSNEKMNNQMIHIVTTYTDGSLTIAHCDICW